MDKSTLSNYGWLVIVTLILAVMLAFATPFGTYVGDGVVSVANGIVGTSNDATAEENISQESVEWAVKTDHGIDYSEYKYYNSLNDAIEAVNNSNYNNASKKIKNSNVVISFSKENNTPVIRLLNDIEIKETITINKSIILDLNSHIITANNLYNVIIVKSDFTCMSLTTGTFNTKDCLYVIKTNTSSNNTNFTCKNITFNYEANVKEGDVETIGEDNEFAGSTEYISGSVIRIIGENNVSVMENCKIYSKGHITYPIMFYQSKNVNIKNCYFENEGKAEQSYNLGIVKVKQSNIRDNQFIVKATYNERTYQQVSGDINEPCNIRIMRSTNTHIEDNGFKLYAKTDMPDFQLRATSIRIVTQYDSNVEKYYFNENTTIQNNKMYIEADNCEYIYAILEKGRSQNTILLNNIITVKTNNTDINKIKLFRFGSNATYTDTNNTFTIK